MHMHSRFTLPVLVTLLGCKPAEAPKEYEALMGYIFEHTADEDDEQLVLGLNNLSDWLNGDQHRQGEARMHVHEVSERYKGAAVPA